MEEIITTGVEEHTEVFQLLLSLLRFSAVPSGVQIQESWKSAILSCSERQTVLCHWNGCFACFFFFFLKVCRAKALYKAGSHVASRWCSPNTPGEVLSLPAPTKVFPLAAVEAGFDPCWVLPPLRTVTPASGTRPPSQNFNSTCARLLMFLLTCFLRKICPFLCGVSQRW